MTNVVVKPESRREALGEVHCPLCSHRVQAPVLVDRKSAIVKPGTRCARCNSSLDAGFVMRIVAEQAA